MVYCCDMLGSRILRWIFAIGCTSILTGVIFLLVNRTDGYPEKYDHSPDILCINCGRDMHMFG